MSEWQHKKHGKTVFKSEYERDTEDERVFVLQSFKKKDGSLKKKYTFESWQMAKELGWTKIQKESVKKKPQKNQQK